MAKATAKNAAPKKAEAAPAKKAAAPKKAAAKTATKKVSGKKDDGKANAGLMAPLSVSNDLAKIVGKEPLPRTQIIKKMWDYIKENNLQDANNRRMINADDKLKVVFDGKDQVSMFELAKVVNNHIKK
ncbi:MAG TPA: SWIB/MDM2 domain-containing protein [Segetibacter sp.]|nr:SWIB/MDM2 domain-containing protein [Segetibacter sp.]